MATATATARTRRNLAVQHLMGAARFSLRVGEVEAANAGQPLGNFFDEIIGNSNACVLLSAASLEAYANEMFLTPDKYFPELTSDYVEQMWNLVDKRSTEILSKFQIALTMRSRTPLNEGHAQFQNAANLIALRNAITHFKPEWHGEDAAHKRLSDKLESALDQGSPHFQSEPLFPVRWMTHANTRWAVESAINFMKAFEAAGDYKPKWEYARLTY